MIADLKPYPAYKDSGVEWLGKVPEGWEVLPARSLFEERISKDHSNESLLSVTISSGVLRQTDLIGQTSTKDGSNQDKSGYKLVIPGDLVYNKMRAWQGAAGASLYRGIVSPAYVVMRPRGGLRSGLVHRLVRTPQFATEAERRSYGITSDQWSLRSKDFKRIDFPVPSSVEQLAMVRLLDHADSLLQRMIEGKLRLIALLEEEKQAVIHRAVTRGLDPNVRLKPSGVDWLGDVPEHWEVVPLKRIVKRIMDCEHKTAPSADEPTGYRVVRTSAVKNGRFMISGTYSTGESAFAEWTRRGQLEPGDVLLTREAPAGEACLVPSEGEYCLGQRMVALKPNPARCSPSYIVASVYGGAPSDEIAIASQGSTVPHFNVDDIGRLLVALPPLGEQAAVDAAMGKESARVEVLQGQARRQIDLLDELRTRLISDVVTGKLDVREAAAKFADDPAAGPAAADRPRESVSA